MQLLIPPENVALRKGEVNTQRLRQTSVRPRTGYHTPQQAIPLAPSFRTNAPVGIRVRPDPTSPRSCRENNDMSMLLRRWSWTDVQTVSTDRDSDGSAFRDG